jgi:hypothetical protein
MKLAPVTVIGVAVVVPATIELRLSDAIVGPETVNGLAADAAVAVFWTVMLPGPEEASWVLVTYAVSELALL